jgi:hypothetical protein
VAESLTVQWNRVWRAVPAFLRSRGLCGKHLLGEDGQPVACALAADHDVPCGTRP